ncbi:unnamed protein product [Microthlaspi erraticum]|uniref:Uncharacterized protein n=1 Tax=Microthlaspi erraticum TaxID=1685480 RepID=A0A6D2KZK2_9BRAS|nr:unnamed protein product [Microthlaspi erraticum]
MAPTSLGVDHSSPPKEAPCPRASQSLFIRAKGRRRQHREGGRVPRPDAPARPPDSIESKQRKLNSIELRVELTWRSPCLRTRIRVRSNAYQGLLSEPWTPIQPFEQPAPPRPRKPHTSMKKRKKRSRKLDRVRNPSSGAPDGRLPSPDHDLASQFFGGH